MATPFPLFEGKYEIITKLKEGGMGAVYKVRHRLLDEVRVIKLIRPHLESDEGIRARFLREARTAVRLRHANIAQFYDFSMDDEGNAFIVMEFIEGITLEEMIARVGPPPLALALEIAEQSLQPIGYLHRRNTIHRDISPDNLMLSRNDDGLPLVKLIDLGIAKVLEEEGHSQITRRGLTGTGMFLGKVRYASPEQFHAQEGVGMDARSDLYSFGLVLYELLTGKHPIRGTSVPSFIAGHLFNPPLPFSETDPEGRLPEDLREVVLRTLAKSPDARFASAEALVKALAPIKARFPLSPEDAVVALDGVTAVFTERTLAGVPGSTQARLDRQFGIAPTPPPSPLTPAPPVKDAGAPVSPPPLPAEPQPSRSEDVFGAREDDTRPVVVRSPEVEPAQDEPTRRQQRDEDTRVLTIPGADAERVVLLLAEARELAQQGQWAEALERVFGALCIEPENEDALALRQQAEDALAAEAEQARRASAIAAHALRIEAFLDGGQLDPARQALEEALAEQGRDETLEALAQRLAANENAMVGSFRHQAEEALARDVPAEAVDAFRQAIALRPDDEGLHVLMRRAQDAVERRRQLLAASAEIEAALDAGEPGAARIALERARGELGVDPALAALEERCLTAEAEIRAARLAEVRRLCVDAESHLAAGRLAQARQTAEQACELRPEDLPAAAVLADVREAESRREAEQRLREQRDGAIESIRSAIAGGELDAAGAQLAGAQAAHGDWPELDTVRGELAAAREMVRQRATSELLTQARELTGLLQLDAAEARLEEAQELSPHDECVLDALVELRAVARKHREAQERARAVEEETAAVAHALDEENLELAAERFDALVRKHGDRLDLGELRRRLREARQAEEENRAAQRQAAAPSRRRDRKEIEKAATLPLLREEAVAAAEGEGAPEEEAVTDVTRVSVEPEGEERSETPVVELAPVVPEVAPDVGAPEAAAVELDLGARQPKKAVIVARPDAAAPARKPPRSRRSQVQSPPADREKGVPSGSMPARRRWPLRAGVAAAVAVLVLAVLLLRSRPAPQPELTPTPAVGPTAVPVTPVPIPVERGGLVITAVPWGEVVSVAGADGRMLDLPAVRTTPMRLELPPGRYEVTVRDPLSGEQRKRTAEVVAGKEGRAVMEVRAESAEELLRSFGWSG